LCACVSVPVGVCVSMRACVCMCAYVCVHCTCVCVHCVYVCVCMCVCMYVCVFLIHLQTVLLKLSPLHLPYLFACFCFKLLISSLTGQSWLVFICFHNQKLKFYSGELLVTSSQSDMDIVGKEVGVCVGDCECVYACVGDCECVYACVCVCVCVCVFVCVGGEKEVGENSMYKSVGAKARRLHEEAKEGCWWSTSLSLYLPSLLPSDGDPFL